MSGLQGIMAPDWAVAMAPVEDEIHAMGDFLRAELAAGRGYFPAGDAVFRAFTYPLERVKVLIVGQDPYPTPGHAMGLSFSVTPGTKPPRSLENIFKELTTDVGAPMPTSGDLRPWSEQGVMLMNRVLTVSPNNAGATAVKAGRPSQSLPSEHWPPTTKNTGCRWWRFCGATTPGAPRSLCPVFRPSNRFTPHP